MTKVILGALGIILTVVSAHSQSFTSDELARRTIERRATEAVIWGMPLVSVDTMREAAFRDADL